MNGPVTGKGMQARVNSFTYAFRGIGILLRSQVNARIHLVATVIVVGAGVWLQLSASDWGLVTLAIAAVWVAEGFNTAIEFLVDLVSPEVHPLAGKIKDVAAGAVLMAAFGAVVVGLLIFGPPIMRLIRH
jgi:diacylglycerol kinase (ATP)